MSVGRVRANCRIKPESNYERFGTSRDVASIHDRRFAPAGATRGSRTGGPADPDGAAPASTGSTSSRAGVEASVQERILQCTINDEMLMIYECASRVERHVPITRVLCAIEPLYDSRHTTRVRRRAARTAPETQRAALELHAARIAVDETPPAS